MRIVHCVASIKDEASGLSYVVPRVAHATSELGMDVELCAIGKEHEETGECFSHRLFEWDYPTIPVVKRLMLSHSLRQHLRSSSADVFHNHGLWLMPNVYAGEAASELGRPLVLSPHGMLAPAALSISGQRKKWFACVFNKSMFQAAAVLHATGNQEYLDIRRYGLKQPVAVIPNGVDLPVIASRNRLSVKKDLLYFGRLHPIKNLELLVRAWKQVGSRYPDWSLSICGPGEPSYVRDLKNLALSLRLDNVQFLDPVYGHAKHALYQDSSVYVLPSKSENFAMTVAESLANCTPVITNRGAPWSQVEAKGCGWWIDHGEESLAVAIDRALSLPLEQLAEMGKRGREWMEAEFGWEAISRQMVDVYRWAIDRRQPPNCLRMG